MAVASRRIAISGVAGFECYEWRTKRPSGCDVTAPALSARRATRSPRHPFPLDITYVLPCSEGNVARLKHSGTRGVPTKPSGILRSKPWMFVPGQKFTGIPPGDISFKARNTSSQIWFPTLLVHLCMIGWRHNFYNECAVATRTLSVVNDDYEAGGSLQGTPTRNQKDAASM